MVCRVVAGDVVGGEVGVGGREGVEDGDAAVEGLEGGDVLAQVAAAGGRYEDAEGLEGVAEAFGTVCGRCPGGAAAQVLFHLFFEVVVGHGGLLGLGGFVFVFFGFGVDDGDAEEFEAAGAFFEDFDAEVAEEDGFALGGDGAGCV